MKFYHNINKLYTPIGFSRAKGALAMGQIREIANAAILTDDDGLIEAVGTYADVAGKLDSAPWSPEVINCRGLVALPGFVDSHTHAVFMGERSMEFGLRAEGKSYQQIAQAGGGIRSSVEQVRGATAQQIADYSRKYILSALKLGTTTLEVKSGYGLTPESELALLQAAAQLGRETPMEIHTTFLGAHAVPIGVAQTEYVQQVIHDQLPKVVKQNAAEFCDVFCDEGYFTNEETRQILLAAEKSGLKLRMHADELADTGGASLAVELRAYSADHLLKVSDAGIQALAASDRTIATLLPTTALSLRAPYAPARRLIDAGAAVAIATDCNPGSSMTENMQFVMTLAVIGMQMSVQEALTAATLNGAAALGLERTHGTLEICKRADFVLYDIPSLAYLPYHIAVSDVISVIKNGIIVSGEQL